MAKATKKSAKPGGRKETPPLMLLALVSQFLANNGFNSSCRIFNTERRKRPKKEGWMGTFGRNYVAKYPQLETIFKEWEAAHVVAEDSKGTSGEDSTDEDSEKADTSGSDSESESDSEAKADVDKAGENVVEETAPTKAPTTTKIAANAPASASSESDSDSDSENEPEADTEMKSTSLPAIRQLKRKASSSSSESADDSSSSDSDSSDDDAPPSKKARIASASTDSEDDESESESESESKSDGDEGESDKSDSESASSSGSGSSSSSESDTEVAAQIELPASESSDDSSSAASSDSSDSSDSEDGDEGTQKVNGVAVEEALSESSGTVVGDTKPNSKVVQEVTRTVVEKKHTGAHPTRLAQISAGMNADEYIPNAYVSYEYADKAFKDLSVTRGKGFTKEKNKKKRGSYRGGAIDINGGKGFKFDD